MKVIIVFTLLLFASPAYSQDAPKFQTSVSLSVTAEGFDGDEMKSYLGRELRSLKDVIIKEKKAEADHQISIVALALHSVGGTPRGYALSIAVASKGIYGTSSHGLRTCNTQELQKTCKALIARFDARTLEVQRKEYRSYFEELKKKKSPDRIN